jgi:Protein of unknown function (DUF2778)
MWTYSQSTGQLGHNGADVATGYSGHAEGLNNPASQNVAMVGPCPQGIYSIGHAQTHPHLGPVAMELQPAAGNEMFGRSGFFIHGDNQQMDHTASDGCLIFDRDTRAKVAIAVLGGDNILHITE